MFSQKPPARTVAIVIAALVAVSTPIIQTLTGTLGVGEGRLADEGDTTLEAAPYVFSIWSLIYGGLLAYAVFQALPSTKESPTLRLLGWPSVVAMLGCALWLIAATYDFKWATVAIIVVSALSLSLPLTKPQPDQNRLDFWLIRAPLSMLAGWLTIASAINAITVLTSMGFITAEAAPIWAAGGVLAVAIASLSVTAVSQNWVFSIPVAWGLVGVAVAEQMDRPIVTALSLVGAAALVVLAGWVAVGRASSPAFQDR